MYESTYNGELELLAFFATFLLLFLAVFIVVYVFLAIGLMKMAKRENIENPWLAWIPIAQSYILGKLVSHKQGENSGWIVLGLTILSSFASIIPIIGWIIPIGVGIYMFVLFHWIYEKYSNKAALMTIFTVLSAGSLSAIFIFAIRNNESKIESAA